MAHIFTHNKIERKYNLKYIPRVIYKKKIICPNTVTKTEKIIQIINAKIKTIFKSP